MATDEQTDTPIPASPTPQNASELGRQIAEGIAAGIALTAPKKVSFGQYASRENKGRSKLRRECYQNGHFIHDRVLTNKEIQLLNRITRSGRYIDRRVEVIVKQEDNNPEVLYLKYKDKTVDERFEFRGYVKSLEDMLQQIVTAQDAEDKANGVEAPEPGRRPFGSSRTTQEARERAGVSA